MASPLPYTEASVGIETALGASPTDAQRLFPQLLTPRFCIERRQQELLRQTELAAANPPPASKSKRKKPLRRNNRVYNGNVAMWLTIAQRLKGGGTLEDGVPELLRGLPGSFWPNPCKRLVAAKSGTSSLSGNPGSYHNARMELPLAVVEQSFDHAFSQRVARSAPVARQQRAFLLDGATVRTALSGAKPIRRQRINAA